jgi:hypothetical protein
MFSVKELFPSFNGLFSDIILNDFTYKTAPNNYELDSKVK